MDQQQITIVVITAVVALLIGFLIGKSVGQGGNPAQQKAEQELEQYKNSVKEHFAASADIVDALTAQYKTLFDHFGKTAEDLLGQEEVRKLIEKRQNKTVTLSYIKDEQEPHATEKASEKKVEAKTSHKSEAKAEATTKNEPEKAATATDNNKQATQANNVASKPKTEQPIEKSADTTAPAKGDEQAKS